MKHSIVVTVVAMIVVVVTAFHVMLAIIVKLKDTKAERLAGQANKLHSTQRQTL